MGKGRVISGAHLLCYFNSRVVGAVTKIELNIQQNRKAIGGIDSMQDYELAPTRSSVGGTVTMWRTIGDGGVEGRGIAAPQNSLAREKYFQLIIKERSSGTIVFQADRCSVDNQQIVMQAKALVLVTFAFKGISCGNEASAT